MVRLTAQLKCLSLSQRGALTAPSSEGAFE